MAHDGRLVVNVRALREALTFLYASRKRKAPAKVRFEGGLLHLDYKGTLARASAEGTWPGTAEIALASLWGCVTVAASDGEESLELHSATGGIVAEIGATACRGVVQVVSVPCRWL